MKPNARFRAFLWVHFGLLAAALLFFGYAFFAKRFLPARFFHCLMHDVFRLYCPFCGGTRAARALAAFHVSEALALCPTVICLVPLVLLLDLRAFLILCRGSDRTLLPRLAVTLLLAFLLAGTALRNVMMLYGHDPTGELAAFWNGRLSGGARLAGSLLLILTSGALFAALYDGRRSLSAFGRMYALLLAAGLAVGMLAVLFAQPFLLLLLLPVFAGGALCFFRGRTVRGDFQKGKEI